MPTYEVQMENKEGFVKRFALVEAKDKQEAALIAKGSFKGFKPGRVVEKFKKQPEKEVQVKIRPISKSKSKKSEEPKKKTGK